MPEAAFSEEEAEELSAGADDELADGVDELTDEADELTDGADELADGADELTDGADELTDGADELTDGADELSLAGLAPHAVTERIIAHTIKAVRTGLILWVFLIVYLHSHFHLPRLGSDSHFIRQQDEKQGFPRFF